MPLLIIVLAVAGGLGALHLVLSWMEKRGWIYYRNPGKKPLGAAASNALLHFEAAINPAAEHVIEEMNRQEYDVAGTGEDYEPPEGDDGS